MKKILFRSSLFLLLVSVFPLGIVFAGQGDFTPSRSGITSTQYPNGLSHNEFNLFTDDTALANKRRGLFGSNKSSYQDERDFVAAAKGQCTSNVQTCSMNGQPYEHSLSGISLGDKLNLHVYVHNNAEQDAGFSATGTQVKLDWSALPTTGKVKATLSANNITGPNPIHDFVDIGFTQPNLTLQLPSNPGATTAIFNMGSVPGSYGYTRDLLVNFNVIQQSLPGIEITKIANPIANSTVNVGDEIIYNLTVTNTGNVTLPTVTISDQIQSGLEYVANSASHEGYLMSGKVIFPSFSLGANSSVTRSFKLKVTSRPSNGKVCNAGSVSNANPSVSDTSDNICHNVAIPQQLSMEISKNANPQPNSTVNTGDQITYILTVTNTGNTNLTGVKVSDTLGEGLQYVSNPAGGIYNPETRTITFSGLSIAKGASVTRPFFVKVASRPNNGKVCNSAKASHSGISPDPQSDQICHNVSIPQQLGLEISKNANPQPNSTVNIGSIINYTLTVTNTGNTKLTQIQVSDPIQEGLQYVTGSASHDGFMINGNVMFPPFTLNAGASVTRSFKLKVISRPSKGKVCNSAKASHSGISPDPQSDQICHNVSIPQQLGLEISKNANPQPNSTVNIGSIINYTLTVTNTGNTILPSVIVSDPLQEGLEYVTGSASNDGYFSNGMVMFPAIKLPAGSSISRTFRAKVISRPSNGKVCNAAQAAHQGISPAPQATEICHNVAIPAEPSLSLSKDANPQPNSTVNVDDIITYTLTISNDGNVDLEAVIVRDVIQDGLSYVPGSGGSYLASTRTVSFSPFSLAKGQTVTRSFQVRVTEPIPNNNQVCNQATASHQGPNVSDTSSTICHNVADLAEPSISLSKDANPLPNSTVNVGDTITYTLSLTNDGNIDLSGVTISDFIQEGLSYESGGVFDPGTGRVEFTNISIPQGTTLTRSFTAIVTDPIPTNNQVCNQASAFEIPNDLSASSNSVCHNVASPQEPNISISKDANPLPDSTVNIGDIITYTLSVSNTGNTILNDVVVSDEIPEGTQYVDGSATSGGQLVGTQVQFQIPSFSIGTTVEFEFQVEVMSQPSSTQICNQGSVTTQLLPSPRNSNQVCHNLSVIIQNPSISKDSNPLPGSTISPGDTVHYTITVNNPSSQNFIDIGVIDTIDTTYFSFISASTPAGTCNWNSPTVTCGIDLPAGSSVEITIQVQALSITGSPCNIATLVLGFPYAFIDSNQVCHTISSVPSTYCGDGVTQDPNDNGLSEECDDGNTNNNDFCIIDTANNYLCQVAECGDGYLWNLVGGTEECDNGTHCEDGTVCSTDTDCTGIGDEVCVPRSGDGCSATCTTEGGSPFCGNGVVDGSEECDNGSQCTDGTDCTSDATICVGIGDETCAPRSNDGCSSSCVTEGGGGGGGGGSETYDTIGFCDLLANNWKCNTLRIDDDPGNEHWDMYKDCLENSPDLNARELCARSWLEVEHPDKVLCGQTIPSQTGPYQYDVNTAYLQYPIEVPVEHNSNDFLTQGLIDYQCSGYNNPPDGSDCSEPCPTCVNVDPLIHKEVIGPTTVAREDEVEYQVTVTLINTTNTADFIRFAGGKLKVIDTVVSADSGGKWDRDGITVLTPGWSWDPSTGTFEKELSLEELIALNKETVSNQSSSVIFTLNYTMDVSLATDADIYQLKNVAFARAILIYDIWASDLDPDSDDPTISQNHQFCHSYEAGDPSSHGDSAVIKIIRPFLETKGGSNIGLDYTPTDEHLFGRQEDITGGMSTSGRIFEKEGGLFEGIGGVVERVNNFEGLGDFINVDRDKFFQNLKNNLKFESENYFVTPFRTTENNSGVYFGEGPINLSGNLSVGGTSKTFVIENGDVTISDDFSVTNGFAAFIIRNGNLTINENVANIDGIFIVENGQIRSNTISQVQLNISGGIMGNAAELLDKRRFIGTHPDTLPEPSIRILFDLRILTETPPALEQFLGRNWRQEVE